MDEDEPRSGLTDTQAGYLEELIRSGRIIYDGEVMTEPLPLLACPFCSKINPPWSLLCLSCTRPLHPQPIK